jgi:hypothetical protein
MSEYGKLEEGDKDRLKKKAENGEEATPSQKSSQWWTLVVLTVILLISGIVGLIVAGTSQQSATLKLMTTTDYRNTAPLDTDFYPTIFIGLIGPNNIGYLAGSISLAAGLLYAFAFILNGNQLDQQKKGANPYVWATFLWHPILFLLLAALSGIHNVWHLVLIMVAVLGWIFLLDSADLLNQYCLRYAHAKSSANGMNTMGWSWLPTIRVFLLAIAVYVVLGVYIAKTLWADVFDSPAPIRSGYWATIVIVHLVLYLVNPIVFAIYKSGWLISSIYTREMTYYIFNAILAFAGTWFTLGLLFWDDVVLP